MRKNDWRLDLARQARADALKSNEDRRPANTMHFTPHDGYCPYCDADLVLYYGTAKLGSGINVTGCPKCHRSYCD